MLRWVFPAVAILLWGCGQQAAENPPTKTTAADNPSPENASLPQDETWLAYYMQGKKIGYEHTVWEPLQAGDRRLVQVRRESQLSIKRQRDVVELKLAWTSVQTADGQLVRFETTQQLGPTPMRHRGTLKGDTLLIENLTQPARSTQIPWSEEMGGFFELERTLADDPLEPGEERSLKLLLPPFFQVVDVHLKAKEWESTALLDGTRNLLRADATIHIPAAGKLASTLWIDKEGTIHKQLEQQTGQEAFLTTREAALSKEDSGPLDLLSSTLVVLAKPLANPRQTTRAVYDLELTGQDPSQVFVSGLTQRITKLGPHKIRLEVRAVRPGEEISDDWDAPKDAPTDKDRTASTFIQSDDKLVRQLADQVEGEAPVELAKNLSDFVRGFVRKKDYSVGFATAADVAREPQGDCTEHAVLLAALARARGLPARVAMGLVYIRSPKPAFAYHMWNEVYLDGNWIPLDATFGGVAADHIKLNHSSLSQESALATFLPVAQVMRKLAITVREVQHATHGATKTPP